MKSSFLHIRLASVGVVFALTVVNLPAQDLLYNYTFDQTVDTSEVPNSGTAGNVADFSMFDSANARTDLHGAEGSGVSGTPGDRAFNNTASTAMGNAGEGGRAQTTVKGGGMAGLISFTITGWFKTDAATSWPVNSGVNLVNSYNNADANNGARILCGNPGQLILGINGAEGDSYSNSVYTAAQSWVFFAVTYDGTATSNNVKFYAGSSEGTTKLSRTGSLNAGPVSEKATYLGVGNALGGFNVRPFDGFLDNIRVYGSSSDSSGVLSLSQIEDVREAALTPQPSTGNVKSK
jgi:hypothetical protein